MNALDPNTIQQLLERSITFTSVHGLNILVALLIFFIGRILARSIAKMTHMIMHKSSVDETLGTFLRNIIYYALLAAVVVMALGQAGFNTTSFLAILGAAGLAVGLALKDSLSNFAAGVMLILYRFFKKGDEITAAGQTGKVTAINIFNTILTASDNKLIIVPNSSVLKGTIVNVTANETRRVDLVMSIDAKEDLLKAKEVLRRIVEEEPRVLKEPRTKIDVVEFSGSSVKLMIRSWVKTEDHGNVQSDLTETMKLVFDQEGISIA